jgi:hypothetical protein
MNRESLVVMRFYRLANISRDLFELILNDGPVNLQVFESRGKFFKAVIEDPMIVDFFSRAGENGEKMSKQLKEIYTDTYEQKRYLNVKDDGQYADKSSRVKILDLAVGTYHSLLDLVKKFAEDAKNKDALDVDVEELIKREENFFTTVAQFGIFKTILELNSELQKELQETQGKGSPTINFTVEELKKLVGILNFTKQHYSVGVIEITSLYESIMLTLKFLDGTIKSTDPKEIQVKVNETIKVCMDTLKKYDFAWQELFKKVIADVNKTQEEMRNSQQPKN